MDIEDIYNKFLQCNSVCTDTRKLNKNDFFIALKGENFDGNCFAQQALSDGAKYAVIDNPEFQNDHTILVENTLETLQKLATYHREQLGTPIIALTGSNGKTTTKELINAVLSKKYKTIATSGNLNNHIGVPLTLLTVQEDTEIGIVEMGANHQKEIEFLCGIAHPDYGYITNYGKAHLEGFGGVQGIIKGKSELYDYLKANNKKIFVNDDDPIQVEKTRGFKAFSFSENKSNSDIHIKFINADPFVNLSFNNHKISTQLIGSYNFKNISVAVAIGVYFGVKDKDIISAIEAYSPKNNRSQILEKRTNRIILDAYNANPNSMEAAINSFTKLEGPKIAFLGDMFELGEDSKMEHQNIVNLIESQGFEKVYFIGEHFSQTIIKNKNSFVFKTYDTFKEEFINHPDIINSNILIKGSRGMAMERVLELL